MEDRNSPEAIAQRASQEDPIIMYLVVRESLGMSVGKVGAQCGHAGQMMLLKYMEEVCAHSGVTGFFAKWFNFVFKDKATDEARLEIFREWLDTSFRKVTLTADEKEWNKVKGFFLDEHSRVTVVDAGLTEIPSGSETVIAVWPMRRSQRPQCIKKLQTLK